MVARRVSVALAEAGKLGRSAISQKVALIIIMFDSSIALGLSQAIFKP